MTMTAIGLICAIAYTVMGFSGFVTFLIYGNYPASIWAFATGIIGAITTQLRWLNFRNKLNQWYSLKELRPLAAVGFICFTVSVMGIAYHAAIEVLLKKPILPINHSEVIPIVWAFMTAKCGLFLMCTANTYANNDQDLERSDLIAPENHIPEQSVSVSVD